MRRRRRTRTGLTSAALAVVLAWTGPAMPAQAGADDVRSAKAQVAAMQAKVDKVAAKLAAGTRAYESGRRHLKAVVRKQRAVERQTQALRDATTVEQKRLNALAAAAYRHPMPTTLSLAMTTSRASFTSALSARGDLEHVAGTQQDVLREVVAARVRLESLERTAAQLTADADRTEKRLSRQLAQLREYADRANSELQAAATKLDRAQSAERARLERLRQARASRARLLSGPMCLGESTAGYANGFIPDSALCPLWRAPGEKLRADAAAAFNRMSQFHAATVGGPLCVTDSYRSYSGQVSLYRRKPSLAATPGTSEHGWGKAVDFCGGIERYGSNAFYWMKQNAGRFGFFHPDWAEPSGSRPEAWHWEYSG